MLLKTGIPSAGHPVPVRGWHWGEEYWRRPTSVTPLGPTGPAGTVVGPFALYGRGRPPAGMTVPGVMKYERSAEKGPQEVGGPPAKLRTLAGFAVARLAIALQVSA